MDFQNLEIPKRHDEKKIFIIKYNEKQNYKN